MDRDEADHRLLKLNSNGSDPKDEIENNLSSWDKVVPNSKTETPKKRGKKRTFNEISKMTITSDLILNPKKYNPRYATDAPNKNRFSSSKYTEEVFDYLEIYPVKSEKNANTFMRHIKDTNDDALKKMFGEDNPKSCRTMDYLKKERRKDQAFYYFVRHTHGHDSQTNVSPRSSCVDDCIFLAHWVSEIKVYPNIPEITNVIRAEQGLLCLKLSEILRINDGDLKDHIVYFITRLKDDNGILTSLRTNPVYVGYTGKTMYERYYKHINGQDRENTVGGEGELYMCRAFKGTKIQCENLEYLLLKLKEKVAPTLFTNINKGLASNTHIIALTSQKNELHKTIVLGLQQMLSHALEYGEKLPASKIPRKSA